MTVSLPRFAAESSVLTVRAGSIRGAVAAAQSDGMCFRGLARASFVCDAAEMILRLSSIRRCVLALVLAGCVAMAANAAVVRCTDADGRTTYQDSSCPGHARSTPVDDTPNRGFRFAGQKEIERLRKERATARIRENAMTSSIRQPLPRRTQSNRVPFNAGERRFITAGMSITDVRARIGAPDHVLRPSGVSKPSSKDARQNWVYLPAEDDPQTTTILSVRRGMVATIERRITR